MKKIILATLLIALVIAGSLIYTSKPEAKAASTNNFRINLKDGRVTANDNGFGRFNEWGSGPFGKATAADPTCDSYFPGQRNWNRVLGVLLTCQNDRQGASKKEYFWLNASGYNNQGTSKNSDYYKSKIDGAHWRSLCDLYVNNVNCTPMLSLDGSYHVYGWWRVYAFSEGVSPTKLSDDLNLPDRRPYEDTKSLIANRIRVTGTNPVNFDVKILPVRLTVAADGSFIPIKLYRSGKSL